MKIVEPMATIIEDDLAALSVYQRIDRCGSVCYQRPPKPTEEEAQNFCRKMVESKHMVPLEMAQIHLALDCESMIPDSKFIHSSSLGWGKGFVVSGSIRAFMESPEEYGSNVWNFLAEEYPLFFTESDKPVPGRVCFAEPHTIPWQHKYVAVRVICSRTMSHQLVRHRPCAILQESQRYCRYDSERFNGEVSFVKPLWVPDFSPDGDNGELFWWRDTMRSLEARYFSLLNGYGKLPQQARDVLPNATKTELIMYASLPEWQHILNTDTMRCSPHADPEMRRIMVPLREEFKTKYPEVEW